MSRILLADDSPHAQRMGERILREEGFEVISVTDGETAMVRLEDVNPDVIVVGDMRDAETIRLALLAAETGHLVVATMQTTGAVATIDKLVESFPVEEQGQVRAALSESLKMIISQILALHNWPLGAALTSLLIAAALAMCLVYNWLFGLSAISGASASARQSNPVTRRFGTALLKLIAAAHAGLFERPGKASAGLPDRSDSTPITNGS